MCDTGRAACAVDVFPVIWASLPNTCNINDVETSTLHSRLDFRIGTRYIEEKDSKYLLCAGNQVERREIKRNRKWL